MPANPAIVAAFAQRLPLVEELRRSTRKREWRRLLGMGGLFVASMLLSVIVIWGAGWLISDFVTDNPWVIGGCCFALVIASFLFLTMIRLKTEQWFEHGTAAYTAAFREQVVVPVLQSLVPGVRFQPGEELDPESIRQSKLYLETFTKVESCGVFSGQIGGVPFRGAMLRLLSKRYSGKQQRDVFVTHFHGVWLHLARAVPVTGTVRLVDYRTYAMVRGEYTVSRYSRIGHARNTIERIDPKAAMILDEGQVTPPPLPEVVFQTWLELRKLLGDACHVSLNETGVFLGVPTKTARAGILDLKEDITRKRNAEDLASDLEDIQRALMALELLRRMFPQASAA